ncbi:hypothetical protein LXL04_010507 [Taraxacum kok-saghyz]
MKSIRIRNKGGYPINTPTWTDFGRRKEEEIGGAVAQMKASRRSDGSGGTRMLTRIHVHAFCDSRCPNNSLARLLCTSSLIPFHALARPSLHIPIQFKWHFKRNHLSKPYLCLTEPVCFLKTQCLEMHCRMGVSPTLHPSFPAGSIDFSLRIEEAPISSSVAARRRSHLRPPIPPPEHTEIAFQLQSPGFDYAGVVMPFVSTVNKFKNGHTTRMLTRIHVHAFCDSRCPNNSLARLLCTSSLIPFHALARPSLHIPIQFKWHFKRNHLSKPYLCLTEPVCFLKTQCLEMHCRMGVSPTLHPSFPAGSIDFSLRIEEAPISSSVAARRRSHLRPPIPPPEHTAFLKLLKTNLIIDMKRRLHQYDQVPPFPSKTTISIIEEDFGAPLNEVRQIPRGSLGISGFFPTILLVSVGCAAYCNTWAKFWIKE